MTAWPRTGYISRHWIQRTTVSSKLASLTSPLPRLFSPPPLARARGSERDSAAAAAAPHGHLNAAHGSRSAAAEPLPPLEPANAVNGRAVGGGGQQRHPNSRSSEEEEDEEEEEIEWWQQVEEVDQEETEEKQEQEEEQHEGLDDGDH